MSGSITIGNKITAPLSSVDLTTWLNYNQTGFFAAVDVGSAYSLQPVRKFDDKGDYFWATGSNPNAFPGTISFYGGNGRGQYPIMSEYAGLGNQLKIIKKNDTYSLCFPRFFNGCDANVFGPNCEGVVGLGVTEYTNMPNGGSTIMLYSPKPALIANPSVILNFSLYEVPSQNQMNTNNSNNSYKAFYLVVKGGPFPNCLLCAGQGNTATYVATSGWAQYQTNILYIYPANTDLAYKYGMQLYLRIPLATFCRDLNFSDSPACATWCTDNPLLCTNLTVSTCTSQTMANSVTCGDLASMINVNTLGVNNTSQINAFCLSAMDTSFCSTLARSTNANNPNGAGGFMDGTVNAFCGKNTSSPICGCYSNYINSYLTKAGLDPTEPQIQNILAKPGCNILSCTSNKAYKPLNTTTGKNCPSQQICMNVIDIASQSAMTATLSNINLSCQQDGSGGGKTTTTSHPTLPPTLPPTVPNTVPTTLPTTLPNTVPTTLPPTLPTTLPTTVPSTAPPSSSTTSKVSGFSASARVGLFGGIISIVIVFVVLFYILFRRKKPSVDAVPLPNT